MSALGHKQGTPGLAVKADSGRDPTAAAEGIAVQSRRLFSARVLPN